jgi:hypothetical protein
MMLVKFAVAFDQSDLALLKMALEESGVQFCISTEYHAGLGGHPDFFPALVAEEDVEKARDALKEWKIEYMLER